MRESWCAWWTKYCPTSTNGESRKKRELFSCLISASFCKHTCFDSLVCALGWVLFLCAFVCAHKRIENNSERNRERWRV
jgi:hypothetical protein